MKYFEVKFTISPYSSDASDLLAAIAGEVGFETFEETTTGLLGYIQQTLYSEEQLQEALSDFPFEDVSITYEVQEAEDRNWNEQWEQEGFDPIEVPPAIVIHDGRHLPDLSDGRLQNPISIEIDAHLAFGTGNHETTRMICSTLQTLFSHTCEPSEGGESIEKSTKKSKGETIEKSKGETIEKSIGEFKEKSVEASIVIDSPKARILDCGTGTGILSICALKLGAAKALGYDIDEWSVDNARHNAIINQVDDRFESMLGDASILTQIEENFDIVLANINRNILLQDMPLFKERMAEDALLILSGFYTTDSPLLIEKAENLGLTFVSQMEENDWACLVFKS